MTAHPHPHPHPHPRQPDLCLPSAPAILADRVARLQRRIAQGLYPIDPALVAAAMIAAGGETETDPTAPATAAWHLSNTVKRLTAEAPDLSEN